MRLSQNAVQAGQDSNDCVARTKTAKLLNNSLVKQLGLHACSMHELLHVVTCPMTPVHVRPAPALHIAFHYIATSHGHCHIDISTSSTITLPSQPSHRYRRPSHRHRRPSHPHRHIDIIT